MYKVRPWCVQPSDRGRLEENRTVETLQDVKVTMVIIIIAWSKTITPLQVLWQPLWLRDVVVRTLHLRLSVAGSSPSHDTVRLFLR